jgi:hypothetical protein
MSPPGPEGAETDSEKKAVRPKRLGRDEHGLYLRLSIPDIGTLIAIALAIFAAFGFLWTDVRELRVNLQNMSLESVKQQAEHQNIHKDVDARIERIQKRVEDWHRDQFSDDCVRDGGVYDYNGQYCEPRSGKPSRYKAMTFD